MEPEAREIDVFYAFRDSPQRRSALRTEVGSAERYCLFGLDQLASRGVRATHNLERTPPGWARSADALVNRALNMTGGYGGDFATVLGSRASVNAAGVAFATVDTVGLPLVLLKRAGLVRPPLVYVAVGLPERLARLRGTRIRRLYVSALRMAHAIVAYSAHEVEALQRWLGDQAPRIVFIPFGVDTGYFRPDPAVVPDVDVVSIGADPHRDFALLIAVAARRPDLRVRIVTTAAQARAIEPAPVNVEVETDVAFSLVRDRLASGRLVVLPVRDNSYSGATTVLLQAMAMGKPVVVSRTAAVAQGYGLVDGESCRFVKPGDAVALEQAIASLLKDERLTAALGARARATVEEHLSWDRYVDAIRNVLAGAAQRTA